MAVQVTVRGLADKTTTVTHEGATNYQVSTELVLSLFDAGNYDVAVYAPSRWLSAEVKPA